MNTRTLDFISKLLKDTLRLDFHYFVAPYNDFANFDRFFRYTMKDSEKFYEELKAFISGMSHRAFHMYSDVFQLNYVFFFPYEDSNDLITIGPYFNEEISEAYWSKLVNDQKISVTDVQHLKGFLYNIPIISNSLNVISIVSDIMNYINPEAPLYSLQFHQPSDQADPQHLYEPVNSFETYARQISDIYEIEQQLYKQISFGDRKGAMEIAKKFTSMPAAPRMKNSLRDRKSLLITANTLFRKAVEINEIHPVYLHEISSKYVNLIENITSISSIDTLYEKMIKDYCNLVSNKSTKQYPPIVRKTLHYIEFNLNTKINLNDLADLMEVSVPYLSTQFKKAVGETIINFTNRLRIQTAVRLLNTSALSIQDIASHVGIYDYNYFTKVFKKEIGVTPSDYRKNLYHPTDVMQTSPQAKPLQ